MYVDVFGQQEADLLPLSMRKVITCGIEPDRIIFDLPPCVNKSIVLGYGTIFSIYILCGQNIFEFIETRTGKYKVYYTGVLDV